MQRMRITIEIDVSDKAPRSVFNEFVQQQLELTQLTRGMVYLATEVIPLHSEPPCNILFEKYTETPPGQIPSGVMPGKDEHLNPWFPPRGNPWSDKPRR